MSTNTEVFRALANGEQLSGGNVRTAQYGKLTVLYSYSTPIAYRSDDAPTVLVRDGRKYSVTTSKQASQAWGQFFRIHGHDVATCEDVPHEDFRAALKSAGVYMAFAR